MALYKFSEEEAMSYFKFYVFQRGGNGPPEFTMKKRIWARGYLVWLNTLAVGPIKRSYDGKDLLLETRQYGGWPINKTLTPEILAGNILYPLSPHFLEQLVDEPAFLLPVGKFLEEALQEFIRERDREMIAANKAADMVGASLSNALNQEMLCNALP